MKRYYSAKIFKKDGGNSLKFICYEKLKNKPEGGKILEYLKHINEYYGADTFFVEEIFEYDNY